jgi:3-isopropylmalate/(R)-2-methylmalate dehydratase small subunit
MPVECIRRIEGRALPLRGDNVDTDRIIPARFLKSITFDGLEQHLFEDDIRQMDQQAAGRHPLSNPAYSLATILLVNENFGCGSSREHAPQALRRRGFRALIGQSFSEIFFGNSAALGLPCVTAARDDVDAMLSAVENAPSASIELDLESGQVRLAGRVFSVTIPGPARASFLDGTWDATSLLLDRFDEVDAVARRLPYPQWS